MIDDKYVACAKCQAEVVGMFYTSTKTPGHNVCFRCYQADLRGNWWVLNGSRKGSLRQGGHSCIKRWSMPLCILHSFPPRTRKSSSGFRMHEDT